MGVIFAGGLHMARPVESVMVLPQVRVTAFSIRNRRKQQRLSLREEKWRLGILKEFGTGPHTILDLVKHEAATEPVILIVNLKGAKRWVSMRFFTEA